MPLKVEYSKLPPSTTDTAIHLENRQRHPSEEEVIVGEWRRSRGKLFTNHACTCILLAAFNDESQEGLLGHFDAFDEPLESALEATRNLGGIATTDIWVGGACARLRDERTAAAIKEDRAYVLGRMQQLGLPTPLTRWLQGDEIGMHADLDCTNGTLRVRIEDIHPDTEPDF